VVVEKFSVLFFRCCLSLLEIMLRVGGYLQALAKAAEALTGPAKALTPLLKVGPYFTA
jgi:hypothetical protein